MGGNPVSYDEYLRAEAFGHVTDPLLRGAPPGNGMRAIARYFEELDRYEEGYYGA